MSAIIMALSTMNPDCIDRLPRTPRRLRRVLILAMLCLLLAVVASIFWLYFRPLTDTEQRLVGTWRNTASPPAVFTFHADRTVTDARFPPGRWSVHGNRLYTTDAFIIEVLRALFRNRVDDSMELTFEDDGTVSVVTPLNGSSQKWQRVSSK